MGKLYKEKKTTEWGKKKKKCEKKDNIQSEFMHQQLEKKKKRDKPVTSRKQPNSHAIKPEKKRNI